ncbi:helix-turn-helix domain-containing protein [Streptomyces sp. NPDC020379]|uniref:helix-turn-helix domain-containing protein n=1 Tax=Streptomyces sp. NPDC020379 TaxID=3365071 RepID=UPI0037AE1E91
MDPEGLPGFTARYGRRSRRSLTQDDVSRLIGFSSRWYSNLERGVPTPYSDAFLDGIARVLELSDDERHTLYTYTVKRNPPAGPRVDTSIIDPALARFIHMQPYPCYVSDQGWDIPIYNKAAAEQWRWMAHGVNVMLWALTQPEARLQLIDWETSWAIPMAAQLHLAMHNNPDHERLREVVGPKFGRTTTRGASTRKRGCATSTPTDHVGASTFRTTMTGNLKSSSLPSRSCVIPVTASWLWCRPMSASATSTPRASGELPDGMRRCPHGREVVGASVYLRPGRTSHCGLPIPGRIRLCGEGVFFHAPLDGGDDLLV